ncbi:SOS response-associated peptidase [Tuberibacillus calidus]|uniref:SOS response-associated peptidase n=1 Tax=Tuberibacillus calidus TaxID=340097 RepID=UPI0003F90FA7|nr:SOS response-associated peptidase [Tuberibacillus calidus]
MCGRFALTADLDYLIERFQIAYPVEFPYTPRYNIAPQQDVTVVIRGQRGNKMGQLRWGFIPEWAKDANIGYKMINARSETAHEKASFKNALKKRRCLVIADSFYEWKKEGKGKQPYRILLKSEEPFAFAGLWSVWEKDGVRLATCTILTTSANELMCDLHDRMPVILPRAAEDTWLNPETDSETVKNLLKRYPASEMRYYPVSQAVNSPKNEGEALIQPI